MKKIIYFTMLLISVACGKKDPKEEPENPLICGVPPARFIIAIDKESSYAQDFIDSLEQKDNRVYFYKQLEDNVIKQYETSLYVGSYNGMGGNPSSANSDKRKQYVFIILGYEGINALMTEKLETIYLHNKSKTDTIQIRVHTEPNETCGGYTRVAKELYINGKERRADFTLHWYPIIYYFPE